MDKDTYAHLFREAANRALALAKVESDMEPVVEFHGRPNPPGQISVSQTLNLVWLSEDRHYRVIDVAAFEGETDPPVLFVRLSGYEPGPFARTFDPEGLGPFMPMGPVRRPASQQSPR